MSSPSSNYRADRDHRPLNQAANSTMSNYGSTRPNSESSSASESAVQPPSPAPTNTNSASDAGALGISSSRSRNSNLTNPDQNNVLNAQNYVNVHIKNMLNDYAPPQPLADDTNRQQLQLQD